MDDNSPADAGTAAALLRQKFPGLFAAAPANPTPGPVIPASTTVDPNSIPAPDVAPPAAPFVLPWLRQFQQSQPARPPLSTPTGQWTPGTNKAQKLEVLLRNGLQGAIAGMGESAQAVAQSGGRRNGGFAGGVAAGYEAPAQQTALQQSLERSGLENQVLQNQVQIAPALNFLKLLQGQADLGKTGAETNKATAEAGKATAETGAIPVKTQLEQAQALAARYKEDPGSGALVDLQTGQPVNTQGFAPLSAEEASILGKQPGERVPLKLKNTANEMVNRGIRSVSANGRQLLVDGQGNTIKDLGQATPLVTMNAQMNAPAQITPDMQKAVDLVGKNQMDLATAMLPFRRFPGQAQAFLGALHDQYPDFFQGAFGASKNVLEYFTSGEGAKNINAFNTATEHLGQLLGLATALGNNNVQLANTIKNQVKEWFGSAAPSNFNLVKSAVAGEISKTFKGSVTDEEIKSITANVNSSQSPEQLGGVISNALQLMRSKMAANVEQYQRGRQGQPAFPASSSTAAGSSYSRPKPGVVVEQ